MSDRESPAIKNEFVKNVEIELQFPIENRKERVLDVTVPIDDNGNIQLQVLLEYLKENGYNVISKMVSYYDTEQGMFIYCGGDPIAEDVIIPQSCVVEHKIIIRLRTPAKNNFTDIFGNTSVSTSDRTTAQQQQTSRRTKERKIGQIIDKVLQWRKLYNGVKDPTGNLIRLSLDEAAKRVTISKKSLDDYLLQIRFGKKYGFNFNEHKDDKVGVLRAYVRQHKLKEKLNKSSSDGPYVSNTYSKSFDRKAAKKRKDKYMGDPNNALSDINKQLESIPQEDQENFMKPLSAPIPRLTDAPNIKLPYGFKLYANKPLELAELKEY